MTQSDSSSQNFEKEMKRLAKKIEDDIFAKDATPEFDPSCAAIDEVELYCIDEYGNKRKEIFEAITAGDLIDLYDLERLYDDQGNKTCWQHGNFDRLHVFSKDLQKRACINIEYTYIVDLGDGPIRMKSDKTLTEYLALKGIGS